MLVKKKLLIWKYSSQIVNDVSTVPRLALIHLVIIKLNADGPDGGRFSQQAGIPTKSTSQRDRPDSVRRRNPPGALADLNAVTDHLPDKFNLSTICDKLVRSCCWRRVTCLHLEPSRCRHFFLRAVKRGVAHRKSEGSTAFECAQSGYQPANTVISANYILTLRQGRPQRPLVSFVLAPSASVGFVSLASDSAREFDERNRANSYRYLRERRSV